jgi:malate/lactate dehydrogenase
LSVDSGEMRQGRVWVVGCGHVGTTSAYALMLGGAAREAVLRDERSVLPVSTRLSGQYGIEGIYLSLPCVVGREGVERVIEIPLDERERDGLRASADILRRTVERIQVPPSSF